MGFLRTSSHGTGEVKQACVVGALEVVEDVIQNIPLREPRQPTVLAAATGEWVT